MTFHPDLASRVKALSGNKDVAQETEEVQILSVMDSLAIGCPDAIQRDKIFHNGLAPVLSKLFRTVDFGGLRMATLFDQMPGLANDNTPFLKFLRSQPQGVFRAYDYDIKIELWNIGEDTADFFAMEDALPSEANSIIAIDTNTMGWMGNTVSGTLLAQDMMEQQRNMDVMARNIRLELIRLNRGMNAALLANEEVKAQGGNSVPQPGGFITRSTYNAVSAGGNDMTRELLEGRIEALANDTSAQGLGFDTPLLGFTNNRQLGVLRDIIVSEYPGIDPMSRIEYENLLEGRLKLANIGCTRIFEPNSSCGLIPFVLDSQLPSGVTIIFDHTKPQLAEYYLGGVPGPYIIQRPTEKLMTKNVVFTSVGLMDPMRVSRAKIVDLAV